MTCKAGIRLKTISSRTFKSSVHQMAIKRLTTPATVALLIALSAGCGSSDTRIIGTVTFNGTPVEEGSISFEPVDGKGTVLGGPIAGGKYDIRSQTPVTGENKLVRIIGVRKTGRKVRNPESASEVMEEVEMFVPRQYNSESTQKVQLKSNVPNTHNFELQTREPAKNR